MRVRLSLAETEFRSRAAPEQNKSRQGLHPGPKGYLCEGRIRRLAGAIPAGPYKCKYIVRFLPLL